jgi:mRNA interferase YafQ
MLAGQYRGCHECHMLSDWLLIYQLSSEAVVFERVGSHSDLF